MKFASLFIAISLALYSSAAAVQANRNTNGVGNHFGGSQQQRNPFGNNRGNQAGRNGNQNKGNHKNKNGGNGSTGSGKGAVLGATGAGVAAGAAGAAAAGAASSSSNSTSGAAGAAANNATATATTSSTDSGNAQASLTLDPAVIATGFANNGQDVPAAGQVASLTSTNNFINFCLTVPQLPITNGKQITTGSCNPAPMGAIPSTDNMPSAKFTIPKNNDVIPENTAFTITMAVSNFETGNFVNADENYFAAPQQLSTSGQIIGHSHVVVESLTSLEQTTTTDPRKFAFFKGLNAAAVNGILTADVTNGLPAGFYKVSSINTAANHQPVLVPVAQHGSLDDAVYFTVSASGSANSTAAAGAAGAAGAAAGQAAAASASAAAAASSASAAASAAKGAAQGKGRRFL